jgi:hypothetical protein
MKGRSQIPRASGFERAESFQERVVEKQTDDLRDLVSIGHFLAPEMHRHGGVDTAASAVREWAEDDVDMIAAAEAMARRQHDDDSAEVLHRARTLAAA